MAASRSLSSTEVKDRQFWKQSELQQFLKISLYHRQINKPLEGQSHHITPTGHVPGKEKHAHPEITLHMGTAPSFSVQPENLGISGVKGQSSGPIVLTPGLPLTLLLCSWRARHVPILNVTPHWADVGASMEMPPFTTILFQYCSRMPNSSHCPHPIKLVLGLCGIIYQVLQFRVKGQRPGLRLG